MKLKRRSLAAPVPEVGARPATPPEHDEPAHVQCTPGSVVHPEIRRPADRSVHPTAVGTERPPPRSSSPAPGKGRKLCVQCDGVIGAAARVCPRCDAALLPAERRPRGKPANVATAIGKFIGVPDEPVGPGVNRKVVSVNELATDGRARVRVVSGGVASNDDGEEHRIDDEAPAADDSRVNDVVVDDDNDDDDGDEEEEDDEEEEEELACLDAMVAEAKLRLEEGARTLREKLRSLAPSPGCAGSWIAFGDECPTRRTLAHSDTAHSCDKVPLACYFVKAFDPSWLDVNHRPRHAACNSCGGWRDLGENPKSCTGGTRRIRRSRDDDVHDVHDVHDGFATELDARRAASRARRLTLAGRPGWETGARWGADGGADGDAREPYGYAVATAEELAGAAEEAACRVRSSPSFSMGALTEDGRAGNVEPVDALAAAATALATRSTPAAVTDVTVVTAVTAVTAASPAASREAFTLEAMVAAAEASESGEANEPPLKPPVASTPHRERRLTFVMRRPAPDAKPAKPETPPNETFAAPSPNETSSPHGDDDEPPPPPPPTTKCGCVPAVPVGWRRWETVRTKPGANGSMAADCYYRSPGFRGPGGSSKDGSVVLRSEKEIEDFLRRPPAGLADACAGLAMDRFWCRPFTRGGRIGARGSGRPKPREAAPAEAAPAEADESLNEALNEALKTTACVVRKDEPATEPSALELASVALDDVPAVPEPPPKPTADAVTDVEALRESVRAQLREELRAQVAAELRAEMMREMMPVAAGCAADEDARAEREAWEGKAGMRE